MTIGIPNILTLIRILLTPLFIIFLIKGLLLAALLVFSLAGVSDGLDGFIARYFNQKTKLGAYLDPIADKLLLVSAYICLGVLEMIPSWLAVIVISRDVLILLGIAIFTIFVVRVEIRPSMVSKLTTVAQLFTIFWVLLNTAITSAAGIQTALFWITAILTTASCLHYTYVGLTTLQLKSGN